MADEITDVQQALIAFVDAYRDREGMAPTFQEIANELGVSFGKARSDAIELVELGYLERKVGVSRSLRVTDPPDDMDLHHQGG